MFNEVVRIVGHSEVILVAVLMICIAFRKVAFVDIMNRGFKKRS